MKGKSLIVLMEHWQAMYLPLWSFDPKGGYTTEHGACRQGQGGHGPNVVCHSRFYRRSRKNLFPKLLLQHGTDNKFGGTTEADEVLIPKRDKWADQKQLTGMRV